MKKTLTILFFCLGIWSLQAQVIITGVMYDPKGSDAAQVGTTTGLPSGEPAKGGFEYVQLMATEDINFSQTPYSLVTIKNPTAAGGGPEQGWAVGGDRSFKFNLTEGFAAKGTFFYVGGPEKCIAGYWQKVRTTDISSSNWIRTIAYNVDGNSSTVVGDGFGNSTDGWLVNSGNPQGIAVFPGTDVTAESTPIDAIFYGTANPATTTAKNSVYNEEKGWGLRIPIKNDFYSQKDELGNDQPFFGQGTNTQEFVHQTIGDFALTADRSNFLALGGVYNGDTQEWIEPRTTNYINMCKDADNAPPAIPLATIETGYGVTIFHQGSMPAEKKVETPIIISGIMYDPVGADAPTKGTEDGFPEGQPAKGGFEYIQFLATKDIDFSQTPHSIIVSRNPGAVGLITPNGWVEGNDRTYKFNLTEGNVQKGKFFYVGGAEKRIAGYAKGLDDVDKMSADISYANWIVAKDYTTEIGDDGIGNATGGLMANSGHPGGIAVFAGTEVTPTTEPLDVVFYSEVDPITGSAYKQLYNYADTYGYTITTTDHYIAHTSYGHDQIFFGQGGNVKGILSQKPKAGQAIQDTLTVDRANFLMLGGEYDVDAKKWITPRESFHLTLWSDITQPCTATLADIEEHSQVTKLKFVNSSLSNLPTAAVSILRSTLITNNTLQLQAEVLAVDIVNLSGTKVLSQKSPSSSLSVAGLAKGLYLVVASTEQGQVVEKIIIR